MKRNFFKKVLGLAIAINIVTSSALAGFSCQDIFFEGDIQRAEKSLQGLLNKEEFLMPEKIGYINKKLLERHLRKFDAETLIRRQELGSYVAKLFILQQGPILKWKDFFSLTRDQRMIQTMERLLINKLVENGVRDYVKIKGDQGSVSELSRMTILKDKVFIFLNSPIVRSLRTLPSPFFKIDNVEVSNELLAEMLISGIRPQSRDVQVVFTRQQKIELYRKAGPIYQELSLLLFVYLAQDEIMSGISEGQNRANQKATDLFLSALDEADKNLTELEKSLPSN